MRALKIETRADEDYLKRLEEHWSRYSRDRRLARFFGVEFMVDPGVFNATEAYTSRVLIESIEEVPRGADLLEMGAGAGIAGLLSLIRSGARHVTLVNVTPEAVANCTENVRRLGLEGACQVVQSDMFAALPPQQQFDVMLFNMPVIEFDVAHHLESLQRAEIPPSHSFADPGYQIIRRFFAGARDRLKPGGFVLCTFGDYGNRPLLDEILAENGLVARRVHRLIDHAHINEYQVLRVERQD